jgi:hypothetical protein
VRPATGVGADQGLASALVLLRELGWRRLGSLDVIGGGVARPRPARDRLCGQCGNKDLNNPPSRRPEALSAYLIAYRDTGPGEKHEVN